MSGRIVVTGAPSNVGGAVEDALIERGAPLRAADVAPDARGRMR